MTYEEQIAHLVNNHEPRELAEKLLTLAHFLEQMTTLQKESREKIEGRDIALSQLHTELALIKMTKGPSNDDDQHNKPH